jgi:hypothetical protein
VRSNSTAFENCSDATTRVEVALTDYQTTPAVVKIQTFFKKNVPEKRMIRQNVVVVVVVVEKCRKKGEKSLCV